MLSIGLSFILICALIAEPFLNYSSHDYSQHHKNSSRMDVVGEDLNGESPGTVELVGSWREFLRDMAAIGPSYVIRDIVRAMLGSSSLGRMVDGTSALSGFVALLTQQLAEKFQESSKTGDHGRDSALFLANLMNDTSLGAGVTVEALDTGFNLYTIVTHADCLTTEVNTKCDRSDLLEVLGSMINIGANVMSHIFPDIEEYIPVFETYYAIMTWMYEKIDHFVHNSSVEHIGKNLKLTNGLPLFRLTM